MITKPSKPTNPNVAKQPATPASFARCDSNKPDINDRVFELYGPDGRAVCGGTVPEVNQER